MQFPIIYAIPIFIKYLMQPFHKLLLFAGLRNPEIVLRVQSFQSLLIETLFFLFYRLAYILQHPIILSFFDIFDLLLSSLFLIDLQSMVDIFSSITNDSFDPVFILFLFLSLMLQLFGIFKLLCLIQPILSFFAFDSHASLSHLLFLFLFFDHIFDFDLHHIIDLDQIIARISFDFLAFVVLFFKEIEDIFIE